MLLGDQYMRAFGDVPGLLLEVLDEEDEEVIDPNLWSVLH